MKKPENLRRKLGFLAGFAGLLAVWYFLELPCIPRALTGIPCPACGLTRSWLCVFRLDLSGAFLQYPMFWSVPVLVLYFLYDGQLFLSSKLNGWILGMTIVGIFLIYFARLFGFLGALLPL